MSLGRPCVSAFFANDVELDTVAHDFVGDVVSQTPHQPLDRGGAKFPDVAAFDADGVVMVSNPGQAIPGSAVNQVQPAYDPYFQEKLDCPEYGGPADTWEFSADLLGSEAIAFPFQNPDDGAPGSGGPVTPVLQDGHDVRV